MLSFYQVTQKKIRYKTSKTLSLKRSEFYGVLEMRDHDNLIHMHFLARNFQINFLVEHINKFNRKNGTAFDIPYYDMVVDMAAISAYPFKFNKQKKLIFVKGVMRRYVFHCGDYFLSNKRKYEIKGRKQYFGYKLLKDKHASFTVIRERIHMQIILSKSNS